MKLLKKIGIGAAAALVIGATSCALLGPTSGSLTGGERVGEVTTNFHFFTPNDKILVEKFDDPLVKGVTCYISRATTGGFWYLVGMSEDPDDASISCTGLAPLAYDVATLKSESGEKVLKHHTSILFKTMQVRRIFDEPGRRLVYVTNSDTLLGGSHKNSVSVVPLQ